MAMLEIKNLHKSFGSLEVLKGVSLEVEKGDVVAILGPSGSGKTTFLRCVNFLETADQGEMIFDGEPFPLHGASKKDIARFRMKTAFVFQNYNLFRNKTAIQNVTEGLIVARKMPKAQALDVGMRMLEKVGLADRADSYPSQLSGGQQQRVALARAVVIEPSVLLFDEPLSNLDAKLRESMRDELRALQQRLGITSLYVTHDQSEAMAISDKEVIMKDGVICQQGTPQEIYEQPASRFVANFIGKANFIDGIFKGRDGEAALVEIGGKTFSIPAPGKMEGVEVGGACCLTVRPESFLLTKDAGALPGTVSRATYYGAKIEYEVMLNEQPIIVEVYNPQLTERFSVGDAVTMSLIEGCVRVLKGSDRQQHKHHNDKKDTGLYNKPVSFLLSFCCYLRFSSRFTAFPCVFRCRFVPPAVQSGSGAAYRRRGWQPDPECDPGGACPTPASGTTSHRGTPDPHTPVPPGCCARPGPDRPRR